MGGVLMSDADDSPRGGDASSLALPEREIAIDHVRQAVRGIRYGEVRIIIQDGLIVQVERLEKQRFR